MSFLKNILKNSYRDGGPTQARSSFASLSECSSKNISVLPAMAAFY